MAKIMTSIQWVRLILGLMVLAGLLWFRPLAYFSSFMLIFAGLTGLSLLERIFNRLGIKGTCVSTPSSNLPKISNLAANVDTNGGILIIINTSAYGSEGPYNALRLTRTLIEQEETLNLFLLADGITLARKNQGTPSGYYNLELMLKDVIAKGARVFICTSCAKARGLLEGDLISGCNFSSMAELGNLVKASSKVITF